MKITALILVGGYGTRIRHLLGDVPKPLASVCGKPFLHWILKYLFSQGIEDYVLLTHYQSLKFELFFNNFHHNNTNLELLNEVSPLGTAGSIFNAIDSLPNLSDIFLIANGDSLLLTDLSLAINTVANGAACSIVGIPCSDTSRYGSLVSDSNGRITSFNEKHSGSGIINAGLYVFNKKSLSKYASKKIPLSLESDIFPLMLQSKENIQLICSQGPFIDIGTEASLSQADQFILNSWLK